MLVCKKNNLTSLDLEKNPEFFIKGYGKGNYIGSEPHHYIFGQEPNPFETKTTSDSYSTYFDHCVNENQLNEAYCLEDGKLGAHGLKCPNGCKDGACIIDVVNDYVDVSIEPADLTIRYGDKAKYKITT